MRRVVVLAVLCMVFALLSSFGAPPARAGGGAGGAGASVADRVEEVQQELDSLIEDVEDLEEPVAEFDLFDQCMYVIGVTQYGTPDGALGFAFGPDGQARRPALALDLRGFDHRPQFQFLAFPGEEPPSIECNEDAGQEDTDN
jgi:hypothetical protein